MTTLIAVYTSDGCVRRCDARCYNAESSTCDCICGGANHGKGLNQAAENTREMVRTWIDKYEAEHPDQQPMQWLVPDVQLDLFEEQAG